MLFLGNPYEERKIVLDRAVCNSGAVNDIKVVNPKELRTTYLWLLETEAEEARRLNQTLLVLNFSHGEMETKGFWIGDEDNLADCLLIREDFQNAIGKKKLDATLITTSCFSGGWIVKPDPLNFTAVTAANADEVSMSWQESNSIGRMCGSPFVSTLIETSGVMEQSERDVSFRDYTNMLLDVTKTDVDRVCQLYGISFRPQDDYWNMDYRERTGVPLHDLWKRWNMLRPHPVQPAYGNPALNRYPNPLGLPGGHDDDAAWQTYLTFNPVTDIAPTGGFLGASGSKTIGGSLRNRLGNGSEKEVLANFHKHVLRQVAKYEKSFPGPGGMTSNAILNSDIRYIREPKNEITAELLQRILNTLKYRSIMIRHANTLALFYKISGKSCGTFDITPDLTNVKNHRENSQKYSYIFNRLRTEPIFPKPAPGQGRGFEMPVQYLAIALTFSGWNQGKVDGAINHMASCK